jgi:chemotaxis protein MotA
MLAFVLALIGIATVFAAVLGGYLLEKGNPYVLMQPAELLIVGGAAAGIVLIANPPVLIRKMLTGARDAFRHTPYGRNSLLLYLRMLFEVFGFVQRAGIVALERDVEAPRTSPIFSRYPEFLRDPETLDFVCDSLRMMVIGATTPQELDQLLDLDIDVQRRGCHEPVAALHTVADSLPGLGLVAAVLGVVITMEAIGGSPETVGQKVAAALVGTFLGIFLCYGVVGPVAARLEGMGESEAQFLQMLRVALCSFARGASPLLAVEYARRSIPVELRPSFLAMEAAIKRDARIPPVPKPSDMTQPPEAVENAQPLESAPNAEIA